VHSATSEYRLIVNFGRYAFGKAILSIRVGALITSCFPRASFNRDMVVRIEFTKQKRRWLAFIHGDAALSFMGISRMLERARVISLFGYASLLRQARAPAK
jgi:hypothetical protein